MIARLSSIKTGSNSYQCWGGTSNSCSSSYSIL